MDEKRCLELKLMDYNQNLCCLKKLYILVYLAFSKKFSSFNSMKIKPNNLRVSYSFDLKNAALSREDQNVFSTNSFYNPL